MKHREIHLSDRIFYRCLQAFGLGVIVLLGAIALEVFSVAIPVLKASGLKFFVETDWNPVTDSFGALTFIYGTVVSSLIALCISVPISVGAALFLNELVIDRIARPIGFLIDMLAAIPSVIYGLWGIFVLAPWLRSDVQPAIQKVFGFLPIFEGPPLGVGMFAAGIILAIMITPTICAICREVFSAVPLVQREAALGLGATRWEMIRVAVLSASKPGILGAVILGLGRAMGETMAVTMVIGNRAQIEASIFAPAQTMASVIANEYPEASTDLHLAALSSVGLALFVVSFLINAIARFFVARTRKAV